MTKGNLLARHSIRNIAAYGLRRSIGAISGRWRVLPDFLVVGAQRAGTTSLFNYLQQHQDIYPSFPKEVQYFSKNWFKGMRWYRSHFPLVWQRLLNTRYRERDFVTGEATPYYLFHPIAPIRVKKVVPEASLVILLRNPVDRAFSHYHHEVSLGIENLSFEEAIEREPDRLRQEKQKLIKDESYLSFKYQHYSYLERGIYIDQLMEWSRYFKPDQFMIIRSEDLFGNPRLISQQVIQFLGLDQYNISIFKQFNRSSYQPMSNGMREKLSNYFRPHNHRLYDYLGVDFGWDN